jgi:uncharacterized protein (DUF302 family)
MTIGLKKALQMSFDEALAKVPEALKTEGFGVLTEIDVQHTLKQKIGADFRRYRILGACNPHLAHRALSTTLDAGLMLPCNVVVYETDQGTAMVHAIDPMQASSLHDPGLEPVATDVREKLQRVLDRLEPLVSR